MIIINREVYQKESPPMSKSESQTSVTVSIVATCIGTIDEIAMSVEIMFSLQLTW